MDAQEQREKLAAWLAEWRLDKELPPPEKTTGAVPPEADGDALSVTPDLTVAASNVPLKAGDIVLLPPVGEITSSRPVYVVLLQASGPDKWTCAPFSRFSTPATEGEFATGRNFDPLKVVCAWNAGQLDGAVLERGWLVEHLTAADVKILADFAAGHRAELPPARRGPPLVHPLDPRHEYLEEERSLWFDFRDLYSAKGEDDSNLWSVQEPPAIPYAAEKPDETDK